MELEPIAIYFEIPATDSLGRKHVDGKLRGEEDKVYFHWKIRDRAFSDPANAMKTVEFEYEEIEEAELKTRFLFFPHQFIFRVRDPRKLAGVPGINMGRAELLICKRSRKDARRFAKFLDYKASEIAADRRRNRLDDLMGEMEETTSRIKGKE